MSRPMREPPMVYAEQDNTQPQKENAMSRQSTRSLLLIEPAVFYANPETMDTNVYQIDEHESHDVTYQKALAEFRGFRDMLVENGVIVTTVRGHDECPDHLFPNWMSTHEDGKLILYPMLNENRRAERVPEMIGFIENYYELAYDFRDFEEQGQFLESTGSLCLDRVNKVAYVALSGRTSESLARTWAQQTGYDIEIFETLSHTGKPVYHTDLVMWIGSNVAAICTECITGEHRDRVLSRLKETHEVVELTRAQLQSFCGNSLEIIGADDEKMLVMSEAAYHSLYDVQKEIYERYFSRLLYAPIPTIEKYGGGSARCLIMELF